LLVIAGTLQGEDSSSQSGKRVQLGPTDAPIVVPKGARAPQHDSSEQSASGAGVSRKRDGEQPDGKKPVKRQKTKKTPKEESSDLMEQKMLEVRCYCLSQCVHSGHGRRRLETHLKSILSTRLQENGGAPLTHKQKRTLKKMKKAEETAAKAAAAAVAAAGLH
jgi:hypothetical protein